MQQVIEFIRSYQIFTILFALVYAGVFGIILMGNRNPSKSLAYIMILVFVPVLGLIVYFFFGRDLRKQKIFKQKVFNDSEIAAEYLKKYAQDSEKELHIMEEEIGDLVQPFRLLYRVQKSILHSGNKVKLLSNGEEKFPALLDALENAKHHIHIEYYIFTSDDIGNAITEILIRKAGESVKVRLIVDDSGSNKIKKIPRQLLRAGAEVYKFMPVTFSSLASANYRNHRKIVIIDGKIGFIGGINIDDRYINNGKHRLFWRDTHMWIEGPAVKELQYNFFQSLSFVQKKQFDLDAEYFPVMENRGGRARISIAASGPASSYPYNMEVLLSAITQARKKIMIANPYFIPSDQIITALEIAVNSGVEVELIIPEKSDSLMVQYSSFSYLAPLIKRGVKIYLYQKGFMHAKTMLVDGNIGFVGTVNMDIRSFYINFEIAAIVQDADFCEQMEARFLQDKMDSKRIDAAQWEKRPALQKFLESLCRLLTPLL